ncbi:5e32c257-bb4c-4fd9-80da-37e555fa4a73 [Sclerotinia trifoliorum]|uniref:5e32c257-bb4c-4fd9-80da-37e555fa4a73 n=1 Tax=Sclerotinia trifoliorum TaxID=28548 RepID=A0A8H2ZN63_9HELO|nr:5e32c257-bb4c-4fd9-80da-37e555fa4a73 [Sclerotinia trifoliorum]
MVDASTNPRTTLHPAMIRQPAPTYNTKERDFEMREPSQHPHMTMSPSRTNSHDSYSSAGTSASISSHAVGSVPVHQRGGKGNGGLCCGICAGLACFECLECCC